MKYAFVPLLSWGVGVCSSAINKTKTPQRTTFPGSTAGGNGGGGATAPPTSHHQTAICALPSINTVVPGGVLAALYPERAIDLTNLTNNRLTHSMSCLEHRLGYRLRFAILPNTVKESMAPSFAVLEVSVLLRASLSIIHRISRSKALRKEISLVGWCASINPCEREDRYRPFHATLRVFGSVFTF